MASILVVDDPGTAKSFGGVLRDAGFDVAVASTGREALGLIRRHAIDLVVAALRLADMSGLDVLRQLRLEVGEIPFVIVTGFASTASAVEAGRLGAADYLEKPVGAERLLDVVSRHARAPLPHGLSVNRANPHVLRVLQMIEGRYEDAGLTVRSAAHALGISTEHLCRVLKHDTGDTFLVLLRQARIRAACHFLRATTLSMKEIADRVGFRSASRFDHDFKKERGASPSQYRSLSRPFTTSQVDHASCTRVDGRRSGENRGTSIAS